MYSSVLFTTCIPVWSQKNYSINPTRKNAKRNKKSSKKNGKSVVVR